MITRICLSLALGAALFADQADNTRQNKRDREGTTMTADKQGNSKSDLQLLSKVRRAITKDKSLSTNAMNVKIIVNEGHVLLRGPVASEAEKDKVVAIAEQIAGKNVTSELEVKGDQK